MDEDEVVAVTRTAADTNDGDAAAPDDAPDVVGGDASLSPLADVAVFVDARLAVAVGECCAGGTDTGDDVDAYRGSGGGGKLTCETERYNCAADELAKCACSCW